MTTLIIGLALFLGVHSTRIFLEPVRVRIINAFGEGLWKVGYTLLSVAGLVLIVIGFRSASLDSVAVWIPPFAFLHLAALLMLVAFIVLAAAYVPAGRIKGALKHPMVVSVVIWSGAHLLINGMEHEVLLFGAFFVWAVLNFLSARFRDRQMRLTYIPGPLRNDFICIVVGVALWAGFVFFAHEWLFGVAPLV
ncbi:MAG: NnrU family protein [Hyphomicrobiales bacterium]